MKHLRIKYIYLTLYLFSCAQQTAPTGGEKDTQPPVLIQSIPSNRQTDFKGDRITLVFNEAVQLNNPREQIIITPEIDIKKTEITARKNKVILQLNQSLKDSTTYTINFRESVQDITERNAAANLRLAFSTGPLIDTLSIKGKVFQLLNGEPEPNCLVALAPSTDTFNIFSHKPTYFTLTDKQGDFLLENLKQGSYLIYAFQDKNRNLIVDSKSEMFGFRSKPIILEQVNCSIDLFILKLDMRPFKLASARPLGNHFLIRFNKGLFKKQIIAENSTQSVLYDEPENGVIRIYNTFNTSDSIPLKCQFTDSLYKTIDTLLYAKFPGKTLQPEKFAVTIEETTYQNMKVSAKIKFNKPVLAVNTDSCYIPLDSVNLVKLNPNDFNFNYNKTTCEISIGLSKPLNFDLKTANTITPLSREERQKEVKKSGNSRRLYNYLVLEKGAFISAEFDTSNTVTSRITEIKPEEKATLLFEIQTKHTAITQLYQKDKVTMQIEQSKGRFTNINPGEYRLRSFIDINGNQQWDWGNFYQGAEPEPVLHYEEKGIKNIPLKANWEVGPLLIKPRENVEKDEQ